MIYQIGTGENNYYNDSDFYTVIADIEKRKISKWTTHSTRGAGYTPAPGTDEINQDIIKSVKDVAKEQAKEFIMNFDDFVLGDTVKVIAGRKFPKGSIGTIQRFREYRDRYGRVQTIYACTDFGDVPVQNIETIRREPTDSMIDKAQEQLLGFGEISYTLMLQYNNY